MESVHVNMKLDMCHSDGAGKKRKAPGKSSSEGSTQADEATEADKTLQVNIHLT